MERMRSMSFVKLMSILFLIYILLSSQHFKRAESEPFEDEEEEDDENEGYVMDSHFSTNGIRASRFLASSVLVKSGQQCTNRTTNVNTNRKKKKVICDGVHVGTMLLYCCKKHCRDIRRDRSNCGGCGNRCKVQQRCCGGVCTDILTNRGNCGKCDKKCPNGIPCEGGICGYA